MKKLKCSIFRKFAILDFTPQGGKSLKIQKICLREFA